MAIRLRPVVIGAVQRIGGLREVLRRLARAGKNQIDAVEVGVRLKMSVGVCRCLKSYVASVERRRYRSGIGVNVGGRIELPGRVCNEGLNSSYRPLVVLTEDAKRVATADVLKKRLHIVLGLGRRVAVGVWGGRGPLRAPIVDIDMRIDDYGATRVPELSRMHRGRHRD